MENTDTRTSLEIIREAAAKMARGEMTRDEYTKVYETYCAKRKMENMARRNRRGESAPADAV